MHKICIKCGSKNVQKYGHTGAGKQRYRCLSCKACYTWKNKPNKHKRQQSWFKLWINEGFSIRQIMSISGHSASTLKRINRHWLEQPIPTENYDLRRIKHLLLDGTYFRHEHCLIVFMDNESGKIIGHRYCGRENYESVLELAAMLKAKGLCPISVTLDGHQGVIRALKETWPDIKIQRCLYHIEHQGQMWLRTYPKTEAGKALKALLGGLAHIITSDGRARFVTAVMRR